MGGHTNIMFTDEATRKLHVFDSKRKPYTLTSLDEAAYDAELLAARERASRREVEEAEEPSQGEQLFRDQVRADIAKKRAMDLRLRSEAIAVRDLIRQYEENEVAADLRHRGQEVVIKGRVEQIGKTFVGDKPYILLGTGNAFAIRGVQCMFTDFDVSQLALIDKGDALIIAGTGDGLSVNVILKGCRILRDLPPE